jgi:DNA polymerase III delta subunit
MFFGLLASQALKDYSQKQGTKEKRVLKELSKLDLDLKTTSYQPWLLIESFLLRLSSLEP